jgi:ribosomal protein S18 acetylase RimI-like enzyme
MTPSDVTATLDRDDAAASAIHQDLFVVDEYLGIPDEFVESTHDLLRRAYLPYRTETAYEHTYELEEWRAMVTSPTFYAVVAWHGAKAVGIATLETDLRRASMLHNDYFRHRFPGQRVFYCTDLAVDPDYRHQGVVQDMCETGARWAGRHGGKVMFYAAQFNVDAGFADLVSAVFRDYLASPVEPIDAVQFFAFDLKNPDAA